MSVARFIADQRTCYRVPHTLTCALLGCRVSWFYKWLDRTPTPTEQRRRADLDAAVATAFQDARGVPRLAAVARRPARRGLDGVGEDGRRLDAPPGPGRPADPAANGLTRQDKTAPKFPDLLRRDFTAAAPNAAGSGT